MAALQTYDLKGNKQSYANWISNLSPTETPFGSMIRKESVDQTQYTWQTDSLSKPAMTGFEEGSAFAFANRTGTTEHTSFTQLLRKVVKVTDTTKKIGLYGRASELAYQMEKKSREMKRDLESIMLSDQVGKIGSTNTASKMHGAFALIAAKGTADTDTGAIVHKEHTYPQNDLAHFGLKEIFDMTYNLYLVGSKANKIMLHPCHMATVSDFIGDSTHTTMRMFKNLDTTFNLEVKSIRDPLGQVFEIIPNRFMTKDHIMFFNEADWSQMVLREPVKTELAKNGSAEKHMIEMELGLRHKNPFASGLLVLKASTSLPFAEEKVVKAKVKAKAE